MAGLRDKLQKIWGSPDDEYDYEDIPADEPEETEEERKFGRDEPQGGNISSFSAFSSSYTPRSTAPGQGRVVSLNNKTQLQVVVCKPVSFGEEIRSVADELLRRHAVVLNLENTEKDVARRIVDFLSGVAYANNGKIKRIATATFIITPYTVDLTGEIFLDELENNGIYF